MLAHAFLALLESRRSLSVGPRRWFSRNSKRTLIQADGVEIYGLTVRRPRKSAIADEKIQTECADQSTFHFSAHCLCWWGFWRRLLASFWLRNDPKPLVILWFLFVYSPVKLSKRRIKFDQHFPITLHQAAVHNARVSPSSLVASTTTLRLQ